MGTIHVEEAAVIDAPPERVYGVIADYREGHPRILPPQYFTSLTVLEGGVGAGTRLRFTMNAFGNERVFEQLVIEPEPGSVLVEADEEGAIATTFTVAALGGGEHSRVTIATDVPTSPGLRGWVERLATPAFLRRVYRAELRLLAEVANGAAHA